MTIHKHFIVVGVAVAALAIGGFTVYTGILSNSSNVNAEHLLIEAATAQVAPPPGYVLHVTFEQYIRRCEAADLAPPEAMSPPHRHGGDVPPPSQTVGESWLLVTDQQGIVGKKYLVVRDENGNVVQEEFFDGEREYLYMPSEGEVITIGPGLPPTDANITVDVDSLLHQDASAEYKGKGVLDGTAVHQIEVRKPAPKKPEGVVASSVGICVSDLELAEIVTEVTLDVEDFFPMERIMKGVDAGGKETILVSLKRTRQVLALAEVPPDFFRLYHAPPAGAGEAATRAGRRLARRRSSSPGPFSPPAPPARPRPDWTGCPAG